MYWRRRRPFALCPHPAQYRALTLETSQIAAHLKDAHAPDIAAAVSCRRPMAASPVHGGRFRGLPARLQRSTRTSSGFRGRRPGAPHASTSPDRFQAMVFDGTTSGSCA